jgi:dynein heavy chain
VSFLDKPCNTILFYLNSKEDVVPAVKFPNQLKRKSVYFMKKKQDSGPLSDKTMDNDLVAGDLGANPLEFLGTVLEEVYLPLLSNNKNLEKWPEVVANDVLRHFHHLHGAVYVISGKSKVIVFLKVGENHVTAPAQFKFCN